MLVGFLVKLPFNIKYGFTNYNVAGIKIGLILRVWWILMSLNRGKSNKKVDLVFATDFFILTKDHEPYSCLNAFNKIKK